EGGPVPLTSRLGARHMEGGCPQTLRFAEDLVAGNKEELSLRVNILAHEPGDSHAAHTDILARDPLHRSAPPYSCPASDPGGIYRRRPIEPDSSQFLLNCYTLNYLTKLEAQIPPMFPPEGAWRPGDEGPHVSPCRTPRAVAPCWQDHLFLIQCTTSPWLFPPVPLPTRPASHLSTRTHPVSVRCRCG